MKFYILFIFIFLLCSNVFADTKYEDLCLESIEQNGHIQTADRLTVVRNHKINNLIIDLYGIPIHYGIKPFSEGCESRDGKILIYDNETQQVLFHKYGNFTKFKVNTLKSDIDKYSQVFRNISKTQLIIRYNYIGNCGGCYSLLFFSTSNKFEYLGMVYYEPDKYGYHNGIINRKYIEYDFRDIKINEHFEKKPYDKFDSLIIK
jgi:hypothetical protein